jgi:aminoglycoside phosphotransferase
MAEISDDAVSSALAGALGPVVVLRRRPYAYRTSFPLEEIRVRLASGEELVLLAKDLARSRLDEGARRAKPDFLYDPRREIEVYTRILARNDLGTPRCYGATVDPERDCYRLYLEKVDGVELWQVGELETWEHVARRLARLHDDLRPAAGAYLVRFDATYYRRWIGRAVEFVGGPDLLRLASRYDEVVERLAALPTTFVHGEHYASNVLVSPNGRVCPIDWEMAGIGPGVIDLAALSSAWGEEETRRLAEAYRSALRSPPGAEALVQALDAARLHLAVQWLGWAPDWTPPEEHAHDWLGEALQTGERLGL